MFDPVRLLNARTKRLPGLSYKLADANSYGFDVAIPDEMEIDESAMSIVIPYADGNRRDGVGDLLEIEGINTERHRSNPIVLFDHGKQVALPIGLAEDPDTREYTNYIDPVSRIATVKAFFYQGGKNHSSKDYEHGLFCEQLFDLMARRYIRAGSIGYQVIHAKQLQPDYDRGTPQGLHLLSVLMLEASAVVMPANADTVRKALCLDKVCGKPLSPILVKSLSAHVSGRKATIAVPFMSHRPVANGGAGKNPPGNIHEVRKALRQEGIDSPIVIQSSSTRWKVMVPHADLRKAEDVIRRKEWKDRVSVHGSDEFSAVKSLRVHYRKKRLGRKAKLPKPEKMTGYAPGQTVIAREYLTRRNPTTGKTEHFARAGDRLKIVSVEYDSSEDIYGFLRVRRSDGAEADIHSNFLRRKDMDRSTEKRSNTSLEDLRRKYRKTKGLRRRLRKSSAGSSVLCVREKDMDKLKEDARKMGIEFVWSRSYENGTDKVKLIGNDEAIDELARKYGRRMRPTS